MIKLFLIVILAILFIYIAVNALWVMNLLHSRDTVNKMLKPISNVNNVIYSRKYKRTTKMKNKR